MYNGNQKKSNFYRTLYMDNLVAKLYQDTKTILTSRDLALIWGESNAANLNAKTAYYAKQGILTRLTRGVFAKGKNFNPRELAVALYSPSYISFETVLLDAGIIFQYYEPIFAAGRWTKTVKIKEHTFAFRKLKDMVLYNAAGVVNKDHYSIATPERAFLDMIYLYPDYYFDNLGPINWQQCEELAIIYGNRQLVKRLDKYRGKHAE